MSETEIAAPERGDAVELIDVQAAGRMLGCSPRHVYRLADAGKMPAPVRLGALVRWSRAALRAWIEQGCPAGRTPRGVRP